jgi:D-alanine-D-alanine ligase
VNASRVLLLSAREPRATPDTDLAVVVSELFAALGAQPACTVVHHEIVGVGDVERAVRRFRPHVVFNTCEAIAGRSALEPVVPLLLERLGVAYTGNSAACLRSCLRKSDTTDALRIAGVPVPASVRLTEPAFDLPAPLRFPVIVKPEREDGSVGIDGASVATDGPTLHGAVRRVIDELAQPALVQEYIEGREIAVALLGWPTPRVLPPGEIEFIEASFAGRPRVLTYASKWDAASPDYQGTRSISAAAAPALRARVHGVALRAFAALHMRDYGRVDLRLDGRGRPFVVDVNPNCDLSSDAGFAKAALRAGLDHATVVGEILRCALKRAGASGATATPTRAAS